MGNLPALPASLQPFSPTKYEVHSFQYSASDNHSKELFILTIKFCAKASWTAFRMKKLEILFHLF